MTEPQPAAMVRDNVYHITMTVMDRDRNTSTFGFYISTVNTWIEIGAAIEGPMVEVFSNLINGVITQVTVTGTWRLTPEPAVEDIPEASEVQRKARLVFKVGPRISMTLEVPSLDSVHVLDGLDILNPADPAVQAVVSFMLANQGVPLLRPRTSRGETLLSLKEAKKIHTGSNNG